MKKLFTAMAFAVALGLSATVTPVMAPEAQAQTRYTATVHNHTSYYITGLYYRWVGASSWGPNRLSYSLPPGDLSGSFWVATNNCDYYEVYIQLSNNTTYGPFTMNPCVAGVEEIDVWNDRVRLNQR